MFEKYFTNETIDKIERIINLIKPKFYNKLTWFVVGTGLTIVSKPLWIEILNAILNKKYQLNITDGNDAFIGLSLVIIALIYNLFTVYFDKFLISKQSDLEKEKQINKDKELFNKFLLSLPTKGTLEFIRFYDYHNLFHKSDIEPLYDIIENWNNAEYKFLNQNIEVLKIHLIEKIKLFLEQLIYKTIYINNSREFRKLDRESNSYLEYKYIDDLADDVFNAHQKFIIECNKELNK
jgi:hypothetical protein